MSKHTPGPWVVDEKWPNTRFPSYMPISGAIGQPQEHRALANVVTAIGGERYEEGEANARLIAAAPDLLKALERLVLMVSILPPAMDEPGSAIAISRAAIAKARGEA